MVMPHSGCHCTYDRVGVKVRVGVRVRVGVKVGVRVRVTCTVRVYKYTVL